MRLDPFRREVYRDVRYVRLTRKQFAVLEVLMCTVPGVGYRMDRQSDKGREGDAHTDRPRRNHSRAGDQA